MRRRLPPECGASRRKARRCTRVRAYARRDRAGPRQRRQGARRPRHRAGRPADTPVRAAIRASRVTGLRAAPALGNSVRQVGSEPAIRA